MSEDTVPYDPSRETVVVYKDDWLAVNREINTLRDAMERRREADELAGTAIRVCNDLQTSTFPALAQLTGGAASLFNAIDTLSDRLSETIHDLNLLVSKRTIKRSTKKAKR